MAEDLKEGAAMTDSDRNYSSVKLRQGYTTGTCAQAATKAAMQILLGICGEEALTSVKVELPKGKRLELRVADIKIDYKETEKFPYAVSCAVRKDSGDDPDITNGILVYSRVTRKGYAGEEPVTIDGGEGIGRVTKPGLEQPVGAAAINHVPRMMILGEVRKACREAGYEQGIHVEISIPEGKRLAEKTFNPRLGVEGGLSVLGTSGIVEPMSEQALLDTIYLDMKVKLAGREKKYLVMAPGNYGLEFLKEEYGLEETSVVKCSNFIGQSIDMAGELALEGLLLVGHIGKLIKVSGGIMNTHSSQGDCRMELLASAGLKAGLSGLAAREMLNCVTVDEALSKCSEKERQRVMEQVMEKIEKHLSVRAAGRMKTGAVTFSRVYGILGKTSQADSLMKEII